MTLADARMSPTLATTDLARAKRFYGEVLGLKLVSDMGEAAVFRGDPGELFVYQRPAFAPSDATAITWAVEDLRATVRALRAKGARFEVYEGFDQDAEGISVREGGPAMAWLKDPDGNTLAIGQFSG